MADSPVAEREEEAPTPATEEAIETTAESAQEPEDNKSLAERLSESNTFGAIIAAPFVAGTASFGLVVGAVAGIIALPVLLPFAAGAMVFKGLDKILTPIVEKRREKAARRAIADAKLDSLLEEIGNRAKAKEEKARAEAEAEAARRAEPPPSRNEREVKKGIVQYDPLREDYERVGNQLTSFTLKKGGPDFEPLSFAFKAVSQGGQTLGEVLGTTIWGHTKIELLHVEGQQRGRGLGQKLLSLAEEFAREAHGSRGIEISTPSFQGEGFYEKAGYTETSRFPMASDGHFDGAPQDLITYYKSLEPDLVQAAKDGDYQLIADYAEKFPERVLAKLDELAELDPNLEKGLTPFYTDAQAFIMDIDDIKNRLEMKALPQQASVGFSNSMRNRLG